MLDGIARASQWVQWRLTSPTVNGYKELEVWERYWAVSRAANMVPSSSIGIFTCMKVADSQTTASISNCQSGRDLATCLWGLSMSVPSRETTVFWRPNAMSTNLLAHNYCIKAASPRLLESTHAQQTHSAQPHSAWWTQLFRSILRLYAWNIRITNVSCI